jgi:23S rRNA (pseudouridine1915-N3)-methyltransferase
MLKLIAVGGVRERWLREGCAFYIARIEAFAPFRTIEIKAATRRDSRRALADEAAGIRARLGDRDWTVALDRTGKMLDSLAFARWLDQRLGDGRFDTTLIIGGPAGLAPELLRQCRERISLSPMTMAHELARLVLLEQIYRALSILRGTPYHR